jgi:hypothetical protein
MIHLQYAGTHQGDTMFWFGYAGHVFYFRQPRGRSVSLERVNTCDGVTREWDASTSIGELPARVRKALDDHNQITYRRTADSLEEAMV